MIDFLQEIQRYVNARLSNILSYPKLYARTELLSPTLKCRTAQAFPVLVHIDSSQGA
jgi:hypothetical protein